MKKKSRAKDHSQVVISSYTPENPLDARLDDPKIDNFIHQPENLPDLLKLCLAFESAARKIRLIPDDTAYSKMVDNTFTQRFLKAKEILCKAATVRGMETTKFHEALNGLYDPNQKEGNKSYFQIDAFLKGLRDKLTVEKSGPQKNQTVIEYPFRNRGLAISKTELESRGIYFLNNEDSEWLRTHFPNKTGTDYDLSKMEPVLIQKCSISPKETEDLRWIQILALLREAELQAPTEENIQKKMLPLNEAEQNIIEALGKATLTGEEIGKKAGYPYNSNFKTTLSNLRKRGILENKAPGYTIHPSCRYLLDQGQD
jgi:hypothetical protein